MCPGIRSFVRKVILKDKSPERAKPLLLYNIELPLDQINLDSELAELFQTSNMWWGPQLLVVAIKDPKRNMVNLSLDRIPEVRDDDGDWYSSVDRVRATFAHFDHRVDKLLKLGAHDPKKSYTWKISALPPLPTVSIKSRISSNSQISHNS
jgi:hypothetical protein